MDDAAVMKESDEKQAADESEKKDVDDADVAAEEEPPQKRPRVAADVEAENSDSSAASDALRAKVAAEARMAANK